MNYLLRGQRLAPAEVQALDAAEVARVQACRQQSRNYRRQIVPANRVSMPTLPVLRVDGWWPPGDRGHPLGPHRRFLLANDAP